MISKQIVQSCIDEASTISGAQFAFYDKEAVCLASTAKADCLKEKEVGSFLESGCPDLKKENGICYLISDEYESPYLLFCQKDSEDANVIGSLVASQIKSLINAYKDKIDRNSFYQNLIMDNMLPMDIYNRAKKLHINDSIQRCVLVVEQKNKVNDDNRIVDMIKELFSPASGDFVTGIDEKHVVVIRALNKVKGTPDIDETARMLSDMVAAEAMTNVRVSYGSVVSDLRQVGKSFREASMALDVAKIFYPDKDIIAYSTLGVGRLIYQLPVNLCKLFVSEIFGEDIPREIDDELLMTVNKFFENNLNVSETARQLYIHRNTLNNRIEKLAATTGLDIRVFDDALTLKIALMVVNYMKYVEDRS